MIRQTAHPGLPDRARDVIGRGDQIDDLFEIGRSNFSAADFHRETRHVAFTVANIMMHWDEYPASDRSEASLSINRRRSAGITPYGKRNARYPTNGPGRRVSPCPRDPEPA